jgi:uncharacterized protein YndB with AHSA1/START domain
MTQRSLHHATFTIERKLEFAPQLVFNAWADPKAKARWFFGPPEWGKDKQGLDFRIGGREHSYGGPPGGAINKYDAVYKDIVTDEHIVLAFDMHMETKLITVSTATVEFQPEGPGTRMIYTEQIVFIDGGDDLAGRREGTEALLDNLEAELNRAHAH